jgi:hypothetical protein
VKSRQISGNQIGFTLAEVVVALLLLGLTIGGMLTSFVMGRISVCHSRYHTQGMNLLQAKVEELTAGEYEDVKDAGPLEVSVDPGEDHQWGTEDDQIGNLWVIVGDRIDLDGDGDTDEEEIDLDGDEANDPCKPVRVELTWMSLSYGGYSPVTVSLETLIAKR